MSSTSQVEAVVKHQSVVMCAISCATYPCLAALQIETLLRKLHQLREEALAADRRKDEVAAEYRSLETLQGVSSKGVLHHCGLPC